MFNEPLSGLAPRPLAAQSSAPRQTDPHRTASPPTPIATRARISAIGRLHHWPWSRTRAGLVVRRSETFSFSDRTLPPGHDPEAGWGEALDGRQPERGSRPLDVMVESRGYAKPRQKDVHGVLNTTFAAITAVATPTVGSSHRASDPSEPSHRDHGHLCGHGSHGADVTDVRSDHGDHAAHGGSVPTVRPT
jgi:hypothetical protein